MLRSDYPTILDHPSYSTKELRPQQKHANRIDVPGPETKLQQKRKKKSIKYKIETKAIKLIKQIKHYGTSPSRPKQTSHAWAAASRHAAENSTSYNLKPQMTDS
jgi:hypothetical protein